MKQAIIDNHNFIYYLFNLTATSLFGLSRATSLSYQFWNILIWFGLIPATWIYLVSKRTNPYLNVLSILIFTYLFAVYTWYAWFDKAVILLNRFGGLIYCNYRITSVIICVFLPALVYLLLFKICTSSKTFKRFLIICSIVAGLIILFFPISNLLIKYYIDHNNKLN